MNTLIIWMISVMLLISPINPKFESEQEHADRMERIAEDIVSITYDKAEAPIIRIGKDPRRLATMLVFEVAKHESSFYYNIDKNKGYKPRGDNGRSWCLMQIHIGKGKTFQGWTGPELIADRKKCLKAGYQYMKQSFGACRRYGQAYGLSAYASGSCNKARNISKEMVNMGFYYYYKSPKISDDQILTFLYSSEQEELRYDDEDENLPFDKTR